MIRAFIAIAVVANSIDAARIVSRHESDSKSPFVASCEDLQGSFRSRVTAVQALLNTHQNATSMSRFAQARITMRVFGIVRTMRRSRNCQWVLDGDSEDIDQARSVVQQTLAQNPCAEAAMAEMTPEAFESAANELQPLQRAMIVLMSESCEVPEQEEVEEVADAEDEDALEHRLIDTEEDMQDHIDELFEQAALESESMTGGSFVQTDAKARRTLDYVFGMIGAVFFGLLFAFLCIPIGVAIGAALGLFFCAVDPLVCGGGAAWGALTGVVTGYFVGGALGFALCAAELISELMPTAIQDPTYAQPGYYVPAPVPAYSKPYVPAPAALVPAYR